MTTSKKNRPNQKLVGIQKCPTGIKGFDEITGGGLPKGRPSLVVGSAGAGKTVFSMEFLAHGAVEYGEPGVFVSFEESIDDLVQNVASLGFDLKKLEAENKIVLDHVRVERSEIEETGEYDLEGLFVRIGLAIDTVGAKRVVIDTIEVLFAGLSNDGILRSELRRLFAWLKDKGVTAIITAEQGAHSFTRHGLEEYVSDAVIFLDHRVEGQLSTRRLRVVKYRGSSHGTNEYPFLITKDGLEVLPITSLGLHHGVSSERVSSGVARLDTMLGGKGYYRGSTILISGAAGSGKTSLSASFVAAACQRGEKCLYYAFEESENQVVRNMKSIGLDLEKWVKKGLLRFVTTRPATYGLEMHLATMHGEVRSFNPQVVVIDPVSDLLMMGSQAEVKSVLVRLVDFLKAAKVTTVMSSLDIGGYKPDRNELSISSLIDTWIMVRDLEANGERTRAIYILKSRGMAHSNQIREFVLSDKGIELLDVFLSPLGMLTGSARVAQEAKEQNELEARKEEEKRLSRIWELKRKKMEAEMAALRAQMAGEEAEAQRSLANLRGMEEELADERRGMAVSRQADRDADPEG